MITPDSGPLDKKEIQVIVSNAERRAKTLEGHLKAIIAALLKWESDVNDPRAAAVDVEIHCRGKKCTTSIKKYDF